VARIIFVDMVLRRAHYLHINGATRMNLPAIEAAANKLASAAEWHRDHTSFDDMRARYGKRASDLRHIAMDAASAADNGCEASLASVAWWLEGDDELADLASIETRIPPKGN
jgi:hypothetical protein